MRGQNFGDAKVTGRAVGFRGIGAILASVYVCVDTIRSVGEKGSFFLGWTVLRCVYRCGEGGRCMRRVY